MNKLQKTHVEAAIEYAQKADQLAIDGGIAKQFLRVATLENGEVVVQGNSEGLVHLALIILRLVQKEVGSHVHLDEASIVDQCDQPLVIAKCVADWEELDIGTK